MDFDTDGGNDERIHQFEGNDVYVFGGLDDVDPERTQEIFDALGGASKS